MKHRDDRLTRKEVRVLNLHWKPLGKKICADCMQLKDLNTDQWYTAGRSAAGAIYWTTSCKLCNRAAAAKRMHDRYHNDPVYRAYHSAYAHFYRQREGFKARNNAYQRRYYIATKPRRLARILAANGFVVKPLITAPNDPSIRAALVQAGRCADCGRKSADCLCVRRLERAS